MANTTYLNLNKPSESDFMNITKINDNSELIDGELERLNTAKTDKTYVDGKVADTNASLILKADKTTMTTALNLKADKTTVDTKANQSDVDLKANTTDVNTALNLKANTSTVNTALNLKADKTYVDTQVAAKGNTETIIEENISVLSSAWNTIISTYLNTTDYNAMVDDGATKYADITLSSITSNHRIKAEPEESQKYNLLGKIVSYNGGFRIYAKETPTSTIYLRSVEATKVVS